MVVTAWNKESKIFKIERAENSCLVWKYMNYWLKLVFS